MKGPQPPACSTCPTRREFLDRLSASIAVGTLAPLGLADAVAGLPAMEAAGVRVGPSEHAYPIPDKDGTTIDKKAQVIVVRYQQVVYAFNLSCPHENTALKWRDGDHRFQCPKHESKYTPDGTFTSGRATRNMDRFAVRREDNQVIVDVDHLYRSDKELEAWKAAALHL
jgi:Rieske Fe-S protein